MGRRWSVARLMTDIAILAVGMVAARAALPKADAFAWGAIGMSVALTVAADRALFGAPRRRAFWVDRRRAGSFRQTSGCCCSA